MIWEESIVCIVMTTGLIEGKRRKCDRYWPEHPQTQGQYGNVTVNVLDEVDSGPWVLSTFRVDNGSETRTVKHFWYTGWPDHGVPETARDVIEFLRAVKEETGTSKAPILVHCSAGIGRTGTFMAIDIGMQELQSEWRVTDIRGNVEKMRKDRGGSVQTPIQYKFIHQALEEYCQPSGQKHSMFGENKPRQVVLQTSNQYPYLGFTARGSHPAFIVSVDAGGLAESQGVRPGDHVLEINGVNAMQLSHKQVRLLHQRRWQLVACAPAPASACDSCAALVQGRCCADFLIFNFFPPRVAFTTDGRTHQEIWQPVGYDAGLQGALLNRAC